MVFTIELAAISAIFMEASFRCCHPKLFNLLPVSLGLSPPSDQLVVSEPRLAQVYFGERLALPSAV